MAQQLDAREEQLQQKAAEIARYATVKQRLTRLQPFENSPKPQQFPDEAPAPPVSSSSPLAVLSSPTTTRNANNTSEQQQNDTTSTTCTGLPPGPPATTAPVPPNVHLQINAIDNDPKHPGIV